MDLFRKKAIQSHDAVTSHLAKCLTALDLTLLGIGAVIGAGIFVITGIVAATQTGPAIVLSYVVAGLACVFSALSYAELAASVGGCGSAYGYAYAGFGELLAWIVGWDLLLEYTISVSAVSVGWSGYFNDFLKALHVNINIEWLHGPGSGGFLNVLSLSIVFSLMMLLIIGVKSSVRVNALMVGIKLSVIFVFFVIASTHINPTNWTPFMPFGWTGVMHGASLIFFAYVGFDAVSTAAEETINPQRNLPLGIISSLAICTLIYILVSGALTGAIPYAHLNVSSPISFALLEMGYHFASALIGVGAIAGLTTVMLVMFYGQTRVFLAMARDGLMPHYFAHVSEVTKTPVRIIVISGIIMATGGAFLSINELAELVNIGTLFAFIIVCGGVIVLRKTEKDMPRPFKTPFMPWVPLLGIISSLYLIMHLPLVTIIRFVVWMALGLVVYFTFSRYNSHLRRI